MPTHVEPGALDVYAAGVVVHV